MSEKSAGSAEAETPSRSAITSVDRANICRVPLCCPLMSLVIGWFTATQDSRSGKAGSLHSRQAGLGEHSAKGSKAYRPAV